MKSFLVRSILIMAMAAFARTPVSAASPGPLPVETLFRQPQFHHPVLSPDGESLAILAPVKGRVALAVMTLSDRKVALVAASEDWDIRGPAWVNNTRLVFSIGDNQLGDGDDRGGGLFAVDKDGGHFKKLAATLAEQIRKGQTYRYRQVHSLLNDGSDDVLVDSNDLDDQDSRPYRLDTRTGKMETVSRHLHPKATGRVLDSHHVVRMELVPEVKDGRQTYHLWYRDSEESPWRTLWSGDVTHSGPEPIAFGPDNTTLYVTSSAGSATKAIHEFDLATGKLGKVVFAHKDVDAGSLLFDRNTGQLACVTYTTDRQHTYWFDEELAEVQRSVDKALPDRVNLLQSGGKRILVTSWSDREPGIWYLLDKTTHKMEELFRARPWIDPETMATTRMVHYVARDGLSIPAYLTLPVGSTGKNVPLVVNVHGGPYGVRDDWDWNPEVQFFASRGYAVLQPQYRGSGGFGKRHASAGWKQWGRAMQDDITDGVDWLVKQGIADPRRMAIYGASYGGYAALMGAVKTPELFQCAVDYVGVSDIPEMFSRPWRRWWLEGWYGYDAKSMIGDPEQDDLKAVSPYYQVDRIRIPVLMAYGTDDWRVPIEQGYRMRSAMKSAGKSFEWLEKQGEGHGFRNPDTVYEYYRKVDDFLGRCLAPRP